MSNPTKEQVQLVINNLEKAQLLAGHSCPVAMGEGSVDFEHPCGTPMCHGGWYAIATLKPMMSYTVDFTNGAHEMAKHLGFINDSYLEQWARENPEIWGNGNGGAMFCGYEAFRDEEHKKVSTLQHIIDWWKRVKERLPE